LLTERSNTESAKVQFYPVQTLVDDHVDPNDPGVEDEQLVSGSDDT